MFRLVGPFLLLFGIGAVSSTVLLWRIRKVVLQNGLPFPDSQLALFEGLRNFHIVLAEEPDPSLRTGYRVLAIGYYVCVAWCLLLMAAFALMLVRL